ncbi:MAG: molecular chaperone DnaK, partial [Bacteroidales bacterium]|nr:molecular chaperone DnaK [Bacteroidales bacterium]
IEKTLESLKEAHKNQDLEAIDKATAELNSQWQAASEELYKTGQEQQGADASANAGPADEDKKDDQEVTDVDFEEVK